jgi:hypothetical protein
MDPSLKIEIFWKMRLKECSKKLKCKKTDKIKKSMMPKEKSIRQLQNCVKKWTIK